MKITDLLKKQSICLDGKADSKEQVIREMVDLMAEGGNINDIDTYRETVFKREEEGTTGIGEGIAIPHGKTEAVSAPGLAAMVLPEGVDYDSLDGEPAYLIFLIAAPNTEDNVHLEVLSRLSMLLMDEDFRNKLLHAKDVDEFLAYVDAAEKEKFPEEAEEKAEAPADASAKPYQILAVTACPTGIAHTYMAAEALEKAGKKLGISIKVETNGSGGAKNILTKEEIEQCDGIIVAADKNVEMARFNGKKVWKTKVSDGIKIPEELIQKIESGDVPVYHHAGGAGESQDSGDNESFGRKMYKHLMNGVSNMLPFTIAGGIFIAIAFLIDTIAGAPQDSNFGTYTAAAAFFKTIGGYAFNFMVPILAAYIGKSIADRPGFLVGLVGGYLATTGSTFAAISGDVPSGFLGALLAGFAGGFLMLGVEKLCDHMPKALNGIKPVLIYPLVGLGMIAILMCAVNPFMGMINTGLSDLLNSMGSSSKILLGCVLGGMMSIDMGGPFNKAAYVFGTAALDPASGLGTTGQMIMASVMVGGMVPPLIIALSTTFFKNRWSKTDRSAGIVNYIMGLSFITEGAIPFAAADPGHVLPSCIIGSAIAGALSALFGCTSPAPHGGAWVTPIIGNGLMWLLAAAVGSIVGALILSLWKRPLPPEETGLSK